MSNEKFKKVENVNKISLSLAATALALAASAASAQVYVGGALGLSHQSTDCIGNCDNSSVGYKLFGGYKFNQFVAIEGTYADYGDAKYSEPGYSERLSGTSFGIGAAGFYDFHPRWTAVGRVGLASNKLKLSASDGFSTSESKIKPYFGLGVGFRVARMTTIEAGADFTRFELDNESARASGTMRMLHLGVRQSF